MDSVAGKSEIVLRAAAQRPRYVGTGVLMALIAAAGFAPVSLRQLFTGTLPIYLIVHIHAFVYVGWLVLFVVQALLAAAGFIDAHRRIGKALIGYGALMIVLGFWVAWNRFVYTMHLGHVDEARRQYFGAMTDMLAFPVFFGAAILTRKRAGLHKRFMVVTTTVLLYPALTRASVELPALTQHFAIFMLIWASPILLSMAFDLFSGWLIHPVYITGLATLVVLSQRTRVLDSELLIGATHWLNQFV